MNNEILTKGCLTNSWNFNNTYDTRYISVVKNESSLKYVYKD